MSAARTASTSPFGTCLRFLGSFLAITVFSYFFIVWCWNNWYSVNSVAPSPLSIKNTMGVHQTQQKVVTTPFPHSTNSNSMHKNSTVKIQLPQLTKLQMETLVQAGGGDPSRLRLTDPEEHRWALLKTVSEVFQEQLHTLQSMTDPKECAEATTFRCKSSHSYCGLGCQIHHRAGCLMASYALNLPLIHEEKYHWPYNQYWSDMYKPLGSGCKPGPNTYTMEWNGKTKTKEPKIYKEHCGNVTTCNPADAFDFPLRDGIYVPRHLADIVERIHANPWLWWVGQFLKYALRLNNDRQKELDADKRSIGLTDAAEATPLIGFHVRRTDKKTEGKRTVHPLKQYFKEGEVFYRNNTEITDHMEVFVASDDHLVLKEAEDKFKLPKWKVHRFPDSATYRNPSQRKNALYSMVRDLAVLTECDFVVCGFTSNICWLVVEVLATRFIDPLQHVKSLDGRYRFWLCNKVPTVLLKY